MLADSVNLRMLWVAATQFVGRGRLPRERYYGKLLPSLTAGDLKDLGVSIVGHRRALLNAIVMCAPTQKPNQHPR